MKFEVRRLIEPLVVLGVLSFLFAEVVALLSKLIGLWNIPVIFVAAIVAARASKYYANKTGLDRWFLLAFAMIVYVVVRIAAA